MKKLLKRLQLWLYIQKAKRIYKMTGKQCFVVPVLTRGEFSYQIITNQIHDAYNRKAKKMGNKQITYPELLAMCVYKTSPGTTKERTL